MRSLLVAALTAAASSLGAQVAIRGVTYDSLRNVPLGGAFVAITRPGVAKSTTSDEQGRFQLDSVPPGAYTVSMQHPTVDSLGFPGLVTQTSITDGNAEIRIAIPSFATLWRDICGGGDPPRDSGFVYGITRNAATQRPVAGAKVDVSWIESAVDSALKVSQRIWRTDARSDSSGAFRACGLPADAAFHVQASTDSAESGVIDVAIVGTRIRRHDLFLGARGPAARGVVVGTLTDIQGHAFGDARVALDSFPAVRSGGDGRFILRDVPVGTRQVVITSIGMQPVSLVVNVLPHDTTRITAQLQKVTLLAGINVTAAARRDRFQRELDERTKMGFGDMLDSSRIRNMQSMASVFDRFAGAKVARRGFDFRVLFPNGADYCSATVWVDGRRSDFEELASMSPEEVALVEVYPQRGTVPLRFYTPGRECGVALVWTKYAVP